MYSECCHDDGIDCARSSWSLRAPGQESARATSHTKVLNNINTAHPSRRTRALCLGPHRPYLRKNLQVERAQSAPPPQHRECVGARAARALFKTRPRPRAATCTPVSRSIGRRLGSSFPPPPPFCPAICRKKADLSQGQGRDDATQGGGGTHAMDNWKSTRLSYESAKAFIYLLRLKAPCPSSLLPCLPLLLALPPLPLLPFFHPSAFLAPLPFPPLSSTLPLSPSSLLSPTPSLPPPLHLPSPTLITKPNHL